MISIISSENEHVRVIAPCRRAVAIFSKKDARIAFNDAGVDYVYAIDEKKNTVQICNNFAETIEFYTENNNCKP